MFESVKLRSLDLIANGKYWSKSSNDRKISFFFIAPPHVTCLLYTCFLSFSYFLLEALNGHVLFAIPLYMSFVILFRSSFRCYFFLIFCLKFFLIVPEVRIFIHFSPILSNSLQIK